MQDMMARTQNCQSKSAHGGFQMTPKLPAFGQAKRPGRVETGQQEKSVHVCGTLDFTRAIAADLIGRWEAAEPKAKSGYFLQIRTIQDQISVLRHRNAIAASRPSKLAWVDGWRPD